MSDFNNYIQDLQENIKHGGERSHYPNLKRLIESLMIGVNARIEEKGNQAGIPDLTIRKNDRILGYIEAKDINIDVSKIEKTPQLKRYLESNIGYNLILTNYLEFRWYVDGECEKTAQLANLEQGEITLIDDLQPIIELLQSFLNQKAKDINNYYDLAKEMAAYTKTIRNAIQSSLEIGTTIEELNQLKETTPEGNIDQNVFDIQQGVSILIAVREKSEPDYFSTAYKSRDGIKEMAKVLYYDLWGNREDKYKFLESATLDNVDWVELQPTAPNYFFTAINYSVNIEKEYKKAWNLQDIFLVYSNVIETGKDDVLISFDKNKIQKFIEQLSNRDITDKDIANFYKIADSPNWNFFKSRLLIIRDGIQENLIQPIYYRPFDIRFTYYHSILRRMQEKVLSNLVQDNLGLLAMRQVASGDNQYTHFMVCNQIVDNRSFFSNRGRPSVFPLYTYPNTENDQTSLFIERTPNLSPKFLETIKEKLGKTPTSEQIFYYAYAIFHSPTYRTRYAEFLKIDFPRLPLTSNQKLFHKLAIKGEELVNLHLMKSDTLNNLTTTYQAIEDNQVGEVTYNSELQRVYINKQSHFTDIPPHIWEFKIGGYQVLDKWLKDRKNAKRELSTEEINQYQKIVIALTETLRLMEEIDKIIPSFPIE